jgi:sialidase-1
MESSTWNRRQWIVTTSVAGAASIVGRSSLAAAATIKKLRVISHKPSAYHGWPTLAQGPQHELLLVYSGGRESHVCPFGQVELMRSHDEGESWSYPEVILDGPIDDRDAGVVVTPKGTILATSFSSLAYASILDGASPDTWDKERLARWKAAHQRVNESERKTALGTWMIRSEDGGLSWSGRYDSLVNSPHGPIVTSQGRLLYVGISLWSENRRVAVAESEDDGQTWDWLSDIPIRKGDVATEYHELHMVESQPGHLVVHIRNHNPTHARETLQCESTDGGRTWSEPHSIGVWGLPSHLLRLQDGRLLMSYGYRRKPFGNQSRVSSDGGKTWGEPLTISADAIGGDLGYPSTVELSDGDLLSVWYEKIAGSSKAVLRQARWRLPE